MWATCQGAVTGGCPALCQQGGSTSSRAGIVQTHAEPRETAPRSRDVRQEEVNSESGGASYEIFTLENFASL